VLIGCHNVKSMNAQYLQTV